MAHGLRRVEPFAQRLVMSVHEGYQPSYAGSSTVVSFARIKQVSKLERPSNISYCQLALGSPDPVSQETQVIFIDLNFLQTYID